jgi:hypothetical protein
MASSHCRTTQREGERDRGDDGEAVAILVRQGMRWRVRTLAIELAVLSPPLQCAQREGKGESGEGETS